MSDICSSDNDNRAKNVPDNVTYESGRKETGYILYSAEDVKSRFAGSAGLAPGSNDHFIVVRRKHDEFRLALDEAMNDKFTARPSDTLVAAIDPVNGTVTSLEGSIRYIHAGNGRIRKGFSTGDLRFRLLSDTNGKMHILISGSYFTAD